MARAKFIYAHGTAWAVHWPEIVSKLYSALTPTMTAPPPGTQYQVAGLGGASFPWDLTPPVDPFPDMLDQAAFEPVRVPYWGVMVPMGLSIQSGIDWTVNYIASLPSGTPFALGGYSQGAAVMTGVLKELQTGVLSARFNDMLAGVMFGNPRRMQNWRGPIGGTWNGAWDIPDSTWGSHGSFPTTGSWARMTSNPPDNWVEFAHPDDIFSSTGDSDKGLRWTAGNDTILDLGQANLLSYLTQAIPIAETALEAFGLGNAVNNFVDAAGTPFEFSGAGHTSYPFMPPVGADGVYPASGDTCYQVALRYLNGLAGEWAATPILPPEVPSVFSAWSTTLIPDPSPSLSAAWSTSI